MTQNLRNATSQDFTLFLIRGNWVYAQYVYQMKAENILNSNLKRKKTKSWLRESDWTWIDAYTQYQFIRNSVKSWLVPFLIFPQFSLVGFHGVPYFWNNSDYFSIYAVSVYKKQCKILTSAFSYFSSNFD